MSLSFLFKLLKGEKEHSFPKPGVCGNPDFNIRRVPVIAKAVKMADRYHDPDPLI